MAGDVYRNVRDSDEFRRIRSSHRRFVVPACAAFLAWYVLYVAAAVAGGGLLGRPVLGPLNLAMVLGLAQFASTFAVAALYARNASRSRDRAALALRWDTQEKVR